MQFNLVMYRVAGIDGRAGIHIHGKFYHPNLGYCGNVCHKYKLLALATGSVPIVITNENEVQAAETWTKTKNQ